METPLRKGRSLKALAAGSGLALSLLLAPWLTRFGDGLRPAPEIAVADSAQVAAEITSMERRLLSMRPRGPYLVVSTTDNTFRLMAGADTLRQGICSTGSYTQLESTDGRTWLFQTPRGRFRVLDKRVNPVWSKPDWAFVEAGLPVPPAGHPSRYERGVLGKYALSLGDGYLVHGTPYQRLLGQPVTHGCVRLGDLDLEAVYMAMHAGAPVYMY